MNAPITVITATIPGREEMLAHCVASVYRQYQPVEAHLIMAQPPQHGIVSTVHCAMQQNLLLKAVETPWVMRLADDDQLLPNHVDTIMPLLLCEDAPDVVYTYDANMLRPRVDCSDLSQEELITTLRRMNWIDGSAVVMRTEMLLKIGGWPTEWEGPPPTKGGHFKGLPEQINFEDWAAFYLMAKEGARFMCIRQFTWLYGAGAWPRISMGDS
jgi:hypothetical protein